jgi:hypothetical protein
MNASRSRVFGATWDRYLVLAPIAFWIVVRMLQVKYLGWGTGYDVGLYQQYAQQWGSGAGAYVDFHPEYPPGALPVFLLPLLAGGGADYVHWFALEMACFDFVSAVLVFQCVKLAARGPLRALLSSMLYTLVTAALYPVLYTRFDLVPGTLVLASVYCLHLRRPATSAVLLGMAGAVKLWPFALVPVWLAWEARRGGGRRLVTTGLWIGAGAVLIALPILPRAGWQVLSFLQYHAARGIQIETTWSTAALLLGKLGLADVHPEHNFGAFHVAGRLPSVLATLSMPLTILFALAPQVVAIVRGFGKGDDRIVDHALFGAAVGFMIAGKVLSPQFMLWIAPLLPLVAEGFGGALVALAIGVLTTLVYPYLSPALEQRVPGHGWALLAIGSRNLLLVGLYWLSMYRVSGRFKLRLLSSRSELVPQLRSD